MDENSDEKQLGFSIRIYLADGDPEGLKIVEKSNWRPRDRLSTVSPT